jgi:squalene synthase HpnC
LTDLAPVWTEATEAVAASVLRKARAENFPVALRWLPRRARRDLLAIYGFARLVDDLGDEASGDREAALDAIEADLDRAYRGAARHPLVRALEPALREHALPRAPFLALLAANRMDQRVRRYRSWEELARYCALSANPVGRLVLGVFDVATTEREALSDAICTALQLIEHCQDVAEDRGRGRVYLPACDLEVFACEDRDLLGAPASPSLRQVLAFEIARARGLLARGEPLLGTLRGPVRWAVLGFVAGGHAACEALERADYDVTSRLVRPRRRTLLRLALRLARRTPAARSGA